jgi:hypothetical protein
MQPARVVAAWKRLQHGKGNTGHYAEVTSSRGLKLNGLITIICFQSSKNFSIVEGMGSRHPPLLVMTDRGHEADRHIHSKEMTRTHPFESMNRFEH